MSTATDHLPAPRADRGPLQHMIEAQLAWQQLFLKLAFIPWSKAWPWRPHVPPIAGHPPAPSDHRQLAVPPAVSAGGEHALFA